MTGNGHYCLVLEKGSAEVIPTNLGAGLSDP